MATLEVIFKSYHRHGDSFKQFLTRGDLARPRVHAPVVYCNNFKVVIPQIDNI